MKRTFEEIMAVAGKYEFLNDFRSADRASYQYALRHGWLEKLCLKKKKADDGAYTYERCRDIALGCKTRSEFYEKSRMAYRYSLKNGWIEDFVWLKKVHPRRPRGFWTLARTRYALKVCCCYTELCDRFHGAKKAAERYGIYDELYKDEKSPVRKTDYEKCMVAAIGCRDGREMREYCPKEYAVAKSRGWLREYSRFWEK